MAFLRGPDHVIEIANAGYQQLVGHREIIGKPAPIPPSDLARLFKPFERGTDVSSTGRGIGLGLYISRQIIAAHGGTISVHSTAEDGTRFTVWLPRGAASAEQSPVFSSRLPVNP